MTDVLLLVFGILASDGPAPRALDLGQVSVTTTLHAERRFLPGSEPIDITLRIEARKQTSPIGLVYLAKDIEADDADGTFQAVAVAAHF